jgi:hypothetical protein
MLRAGRFSLQRFLAQAGQKQGVATLAGRENRTHRSDPHLKNRRLAPANGRAQCLANKKKARFDYRSMKIHMRERQDIARRQYPEGQAKSTPVIAMTLSWRNCRGGSGHGDFQARRSIRIAYQLVRYAKSQRIQGGNPTSQ